MRFIKSKPVAVVLALAACVVVSAGTALAINFFIISPLFYFPGTSASLSAYQVGIYDADRKVDVDVLLVNPTPRELEAFVVLFDEDEEPVACERFTLSPNDRDELELDEFDDLDEGVIKVVTFQRPGNQFYEAVQAGVVGWVRTEFELFGAPISITETPLRSLPVELLFDNNYYELNLIVDYVAENCAEDEEA